MTAASSPEFGTSGTGKSERTEPGAAREPLPEACACESCQDAAWPQAKGHDAASSRGSEKPGPSEDYKAFLRGEITAEEYVRRLKAKVDRRIRERP